MTQFKRTGGPATAEKHSKSNLYHIEQLSANEGVAIFLDEKHGLAHEYSIKAKPGASARSVSDAFRKYNNNLKETGSVGQSYHAGFRNNPLLDIRRVKSYGKNKK